MYGGQSSFVNTWLPFVVYLSVPHNGTLRYCTGTAVHTGWVLTAAHCFRPAFDLYGLPTASFLRGDGTTTTRRLDSIAYHPGGRDLALCRLQRRLPGSIPVDLPADPFESRGECLTAGFGLGPALEVDDRIAMSYLTVQLSDKAFCSKFSMASTMCFASMDGKLGSCAGDSGAPLFCDGVLRGVMSRSLATDKECGKTKLGIYFFEDVYEVLDWINSVVGPTGPPSRGMGWNAGGAPKPGLTSLLFAILTSVWIIYCLFPP